jgi:colanic acid biosynthesis glycosyl transferase WcaI
LEFEMFFREKSNKLGSAGVTAKDLGKPTRILIHTMNFYPELIGVGKYLGELAFSLAEMGHRVEVVAAPPHYPEWKVRVAYRGWWYRWEEIKGVWALRCPLVTGNGVGIWRLLAPLSFAAFAAPAVFYRILRTRPDVAMCVEPTLFSAPATLLAGKIVGARTVLYVQDLEVDAAFQVGHLKSGWIRSLALRWERALLRRFDLTVTISQRMRAALLRKGAEAESTVILRNWVDLATIQPLPRDARNAYRDAWAIPDDAFVVLYSGQMGKKQALNFVLDAAARCLDQPRLRFVFVGDGPAKAELIETYGRMPNVSFHPLQPAERLNELLNAADLHILPQIRAAADLVLPSKLGGMLASGRPVLATVDADTELARLLEGVALRVAPEDSAALAEAIAAASTRDLAPLGERGLSLATLFSDRHILPRFEEALVGPLPRYGGAADPLADRLSQA